MSPCNIAVFFDITHDPLVPACRAVSSHQLVASESDEDGSLSEGGGEVRPSLSAIALAKAEARAAAQERGRLAREFRLADLPGPVFWCFTKNTGRLDCIQRQPTTDLTVFNSINSPPSHAQSRPVNLPRRSETKTGTQSHPVKLKKSNRPPWRPLTFGFWPLVTLHATRFTPLVNQAQSSPINLPRRLVAP
jgi:hypothetical protein